tara:strand:- start:529 stop:873 length:345 start_codon:yes stop_codon:yes gene_type:complete
MLKNLLITSLLFLLGHILVWFQLNGQFIWKVWKDNLILVSLIGIPTSIFFIWATKWGVKTFDGLFWPPRFIGFSIGIVVYGLLVSHYFNQGINLKTLVTLSLALIIVTIQVFWK